MKFKKPKFWDSNRPNIISYLLSIFTLPIIINNFFLNFKKKDKYEKIKKICVGNIYIGGTGKTPSTIKLYEIFRNLKFDVVTGKKNYTTQIDEITLLKNKTTLITESDRPKIAQKALDNKKDIVIFDDGLQDKSLNYDLKLVCFDSENWIGNGQLIPAGPLREKLSSLKKYDLVFLKNKNDNLENIIYQLKKNNPQIKIFNTNYKPKNIEKFNSTKKYLIFSGIGNPKSFKEILSKNNIQIIDEIIFPDHYYFKKNDIKKIKKRAKNLNAEIITTEKDYLRISDEERKDINFLEIKLEIENENELINFIKSKIDV